ncbi:NACHT domain-containing protein [Streptomyces nigrescens]|uniref:NACHT domain-containing protein n=1 Tax=Streptomyces nigrescens TaxID=1920 RepID=UPI0037023131
MMRRGFWYKFTVAAFAAFAVCMACWAARGLSMSGSKGLPVLAAFTGLSGVASLFITWNSSRTSRFERVSGKSLHDAADRLAQGLIEERAQTERRFRLNDPYPMPVPWTAAPSDLVDDLEEQSKVARNFPGFTADQSADWLTRVDDLDGQGNDLTKILERCPTGRLVVLGEPGAGKTILLSRLQWDLLEKRESGGSVPVIFPLAEWNPDDHDLHSWMSERLILEHPFTEYPYLDEEGSPSKASALLKRKFILPILDGFDEVPSQSRYSVLDKINQSLLMGLPMVLSSRTEDFRSALTVGSGAGIRLTGAAGIEVSPVPAAEARDYLLRDSGGAGTQTARRWDSIVQELGSNSVLGEALRTPLALFVCRTIYKARPASGAHAVPSPDELCDRSRFPDAEAVKKYLFRAYIPAVYSGDASGSPRGRLTPERAVRAHRAIARHMSVTLGGATEIRWWDFHRVSRRTVTWTSLGLALAIFLLLFLPLLHERVSAVAFTIPAIFALLTFLTLRSVLRSSYRVLTNGVRWKFKPYIALIGAAAGCVARMTRQSMDESYAGTLHMREGPNLTSVLFSTQSIGWIACGVVLFLMGFCWTPRTADTALPISPLGSLRIDRRTFVKIFAIWAGSAAISVAAVLGACFSLPPTTPPEMVDEVVVVFAVAFCGLGVTIGLGVGIFFAFRYTAWGMFVIARPLRAILSQTPLRLMTFLEHAHKLGVLRKAGPSYKFRHSEVYRSLLG